MLYEYAVDPVALGSSWARCRYVLDQAGWSLGRLIVAYPRRSWMREAIRASEPLRDVEKARVREALRLARNYKVVRTGRTVQDVSLDWLGDAIRQQSVDPFRAIVADAPDDVANSVLNIDGVNGAVPLWDCPANWQVPKSGVAIAAALDPLIRHSHELKLIDPYFDVTSRRYLPTLREILARAAVVGLAVVEVHCQERDQVLDIAALERQAPLRLQAQIPNDVALKVHWWSEKPGGRRLHARYAVSDRGGVRIDHGFSEQAGAVEDLALMSEPVRADIFDAFSSAGRAYDQVGDCLEITNTSIARVVP